MLAGGRMRRDGRSLMRAAGKYRLKIAVAIVIGIFWGAVFAFIHPNGLFSFTRNIHIHRVTKQQESKCIYTEYLNVMKSQLLECQSDHFDLKHDHKVLGAKISFCEQVVFTTRRQMRQMIAQQPVGPFGTVKGLTTNPPVVPMNSVNPRLAKILETVAVERELIVALADSNVKEMLEVWFSCIKILRIPNYLVVAMDNGTASFCRKNGVPVYERDANDTLMDRNGGGGGNHEVSGLKFRVLRDFLQLGYSVLLSDVDIVYLRNPFDYLHRDSDIESMTDGHDNLTSYGYDDVDDEPEMGWARYAHTTRIWDYNSGFFFIRPTIPSIELLDRVAARLRKEDECDQRVFNEELFFPSRPDYEGLHASKRTMDFHLFMNSKVLFKIVRNDAQLREVRPVVVHINYHSDKLPRMKAVLEYFENRTTAAFYSFPDGSD